MLFVKWRYGFFFFVTIDVTKDKSENMKEVGDKMQKLMGEPRNYGPTPDELAEMKRIEEEARLKRETEERAERERREAEEAADRKRKQEEWVFMAFTKCMNILNWSPLH